MDTYKATNTTNGRFYIGSTKDFEKRKKQHLKSSKKLPFQNALRKNPEAFEWEVWTDDSDEPILEQTLLDMWFGCEQCYNLNPFASRPPSRAGISQSKGHKEKLSRVRKGSKRQGSGPRFHPVEVTHPDGSKTIFDTRIEAASALGVSPVTIKGYIRTSKPLSKGRFKGHQFSYSGGWKRFN
jgi:hypothetical protein